MINDILFLEDRRIILISGVKQGLLLYDVSDLKNLVQLSIFGATTFEMNKIVELDSNKIIITVLGGFLILDITQPKNI